LPISQRIIENHGGTIEVRSQAGTGATFTVLLPVESDAYAAYADKKPAVPTFTRPAGLSLPGPATPLPIPIGAMPFTPGLTPPPVAMRMEATPPPVTSSATTPVPGLGKTLPLGTMPPQKR
jgi:hypothetical protein